MSDVLHLYGFGDVDRSGKVRWTAAELGIPVEEKRVAFPEHRQPDYLAKNPLGAIGGCCRRPTWSSRRLW